MKKYFVIIFAILIAGMTIAVAANQSDSEVNIDGDIGPNPWEQPFATMEVTLSEETTPSESNVPESSTPEVSIPESTPSETDAPDVSASDETAGPVTTDKETLSSHRTCDGMPTPPVSVAKGKVKQATKKKNAVKVKLTFKKLNKATKYQVKISTTKKFKKKKTVTKLVKKTKVTLKIKRFRKSKKLYVKVRGVNGSGRKRIYGGWSKVKRVKIK